MNYLYSLRTDNATDKNGQNISVYGITVLRIEGSIPNIFTDESEAKEFISLCNREELDPIHLQSVIEDMILR